MDQTLPGLLLVPHLLQALSSNMWSPVSEHPSLVNFMEPWISVPGLGGLEGEMGGRGDF